jgi:hypothetical protein
LRTVDFRAIAAAGIYMGYYLCPILAIGVKICVKDAGATAELQLAALNLYHIKSGLAEHANQR